ncbi:MAG: hypothetical protein WCS37_23115 [Chloroflexota bacterium]|nr:hypothetical protein [Chloroflexota bacterium]
MSQNSFHGYLVHHQVLIRECCLASVAIRSNFRSASLSASQIIDSVALAASGQVEEERIIPLFLELGTLLSKEGWPIKLALEVIHTYPIAVWNVLSPHYLIENNPQTHSGKNQLVRVGFDAGEFQQLSQKVNMWVEWVVEAYVAQKEEYITNLYCQLTEDTSNRELQLQAAQATGNTICNLLGQPLTIIEAMVNLAKNGTLKPVEVRWLQRATLQTNQVLEKLRNLKRYETTPSIPPALDLEASSMDQTCASILTSSTVSRKDLV